MFRNPAADHHHRIDPWLSLPVTRDLHVIHAAEEIQHLVFDIALRSNLNEMIVGIPLLAVDAECVLTGRMSVEFHADIRSGRIAVLTDAEIHKPVAEKELCRPVDDVPEIVGCVDAVPRRRGETPAGHIRECRSLPRRCEGASPDHDEGKENRSE